MFHFDRDETENAIDSAIRLRLVAEQRLRTRGDEVTEEVLSRPGRYRTVAENLEVKEVIVGEGERRRRYAVCFNPLEAKRQKSHREDLLNELAAELASLSDLSDLSQGIHTKRVCALRTSARYGRLLKDTKRGLAIDRQAIPRAGALRRQVRRA